MNVIERYVVGQGVELRVCEQADPVNHAERHYAELILHEGNKERFLCKTHAAYALSGNLSLLAVAVIDLTLAE